CSTASAPPTRWSECSRVPHAVRRHKRVYARLRRAMALVERCTADAGPRFLFRAAIKINRGPGSAAQHFVLRCARDTRWACGDDKPVPAWHARAMDVVVEQVSKIWPDTRGSGVAALENFSHRFRSRRITCLLGPSGCGKSTLIQIVAGLESASSGSVSIVDPQRGDTRRPLGADSVMVWQNLNLFPWRSVIDNVAFGLEMQGMAKAARHQRARALIASVGLRGFETHLPGQLSGGMRQRVALARALIMARPILLMDEPFAALDAQTKIVMQEELLRIFDETHKTILFVTHAL